MRSMNLPDLSSWDSGPVTLPGAGSLHLHGHHTFLGMTGLDPSSHPTSMIPEAKVKGKSDPN